MVNAKIYERFEWNRFMQRRDLKWMDVIAAVFNFFLLYTAAFLILSNGNAQYGEEGAVSMEIDR